MGDLTEINSIDKFYTTPTGRNVKELEFDSNDSNKYSWQELALKRWVDNGFKGIVEASTGAGKTIFCFKAMTALMENKQNESIEISIIVPTDALMLQWKDEILLKTKFKENIIALHGGKFKNDRNVINIYIVNTAREKLPELTEEVLGSKKHFLIVDEAHRTTSAVNSKIYNCKKHYTLGVSATFPEIEEQFRILESNLGDLLAIYRYAHALKRGTISKFDLTFLEVDLTDLETEEWRSLTSRAMSFEDPWRTRMFGKRAWISWKTAERTACALKLIEKLIGENKKIIVFHKEIVGIEVLYNLLKANNHPIGIYHSEMDDHIRHNFLKAFKENKIKVLLSAQALLEGLDVPDADVGIAVAFDKSSIRIIQSLGRVLRIKEGEPLKHYYSILVRDTTDAQLEIKFRSSLLDHNGNELVPIHKFDGQEFLGAFEDAESLKERGGLIEVDLKADVADDPNIKKVNITYPDWALVKPNIIRRVSKPLVKNNNEIALSKCKFTFWLKNNATHLPFIVLDENKNKKQLGTNKKKEALELQKRANGRGIKLYIKVKNSVAKSGKTTKEAVKLSDKKYSFWLKKNNKLYPYTTKQNGIVVHVGSDNQEKALKFKKEVFEKFGINLLISKA